MNLKILFTEFEPHQDTLDELFSSDRVEEDGWNTGTWAYDGIHRVWIGDLHLVVDCIELEDWWDAKTTDAQKRKLYKSLLGSLRVALGTKIDDVKFSPDIGVEKHDDGSYYWST
jgi:hypothetical protein